MTQLLLVSLASLWAWEGLRGFLPFTIPRLLAPLAVFGVACGAESVPFRFLLAAAAAGGVAVLRRLAGAGESKPFPLRDARAMVRPPSRATSPGVRGRAPVSTLGKRVPKL